MAAKKEIRGVHRHKYEVICSGLFPAIRLWQNTIHFYRQPEREVTGA